MSKIPGFRSGKAWKKIVATIGYLIIALIVIGIALGDDESKPTNAPATISSSQPPAQSSAKPSDSAGAEAPKPKDTAPAKPSVKTYKQGMYKIGADMTAGEYVLVGKGMSYFEVDKDSSGQMDSIISNDNFSNRSIITVQDGQYLKIQNCTAYAFKDAPKVEVSADGFLSAGMYKVGVDLPAGEYKVIADGMGYVEVNTASLHSLNNIVSNDNFQGERYITVKDGQYLKLGGAKIKVK